jgi:hypothetical protein
MSQMKTWAGSRISALALLGITAFGLPGAAFSENIRDNMARLAQLTPADLTQEGILLGDATRLYPANSHPIGKRHEGCNVSANVQTRCPLGPFTTDF